MVFLRVPEYQRIKNKMSYSVSSFIAWVLYYSCGSYAFSHTSFSFWINWNRVNSRKLYVKERKPNGCQQSPDGNINWNQKTLAHSFIWHFCSVKIILWIWNLFGSNADCKERLKNSNCKNMEKNSAKQLLARVVSNFHKDVIHKSKLYGRASDVAVGGESCTGFDRVSYVAPEILSPLEYIFIFFTWATLCVLFLWFYISAVCLFMSS